METPSFLGRVTRSQAASASQPKKHKEASSRSRNNKNQERAVLQDVTNDSPINGVATEKTPLSSIIKAVSLPKKTPGSGEALLRGQVKILLEKVEEGADLVNKFSNRLYAPSFPGLGILPISPGLLAAPTPANTPQIFSNIKVQEEIGEAAALVMKNILVGPPKVTESVKFKEPLGECVLNRAVLFEESVEECELNRALLFDSPDKFEASDVSSFVSSSVTYQGSTVCSSHDDNWSIQANVSAYTDNEEDELAESDVEETGEDEEDEEEEEEYDEEDENGGGRYLDELCEGLRKIAVEDNNELRLPEFTGKHTRFIYNSDEEIEGEEIVARKVLSPSVLLLKGLPAPEGKHLRFPVEEGEE